MHNLNVICSTCTTDTKKNQSTQIIVLISWCDPFKLFRWPAVKRCEAWWAHISIITNGKQFTIFWLDGNEADDLTSPMLNWSKTSSLSQKALKCSKVCKSGHDKCFKSVTLLCCRRSAEVSVKQREEWRSWTHRRCFNVQSTQTHTNIPDCCWSGWCWYCIHLSSCVDTFAKQTVILRPDLKGATQQAN